MYNPHDNHYFIEYILKEMRRESNLSLQKNQPQKRQVVEVRDKLLKGIQNTVVMTQVSCCLSVNIQM